MDEKKVKKAYNAVQKEIKEQQIKEIKKIIKTTLEKVEVLKKQRKELDDKIRYLKMDLNDFKVGRLDRIEERQKKDKNARENSVVIIEKVVEIVRNYSPKYHPYAVYWQTKPDYSNLDNSASLGTSSLTITSQSSSPVTLNGSIVKNNSIGSYKLKNKTINFR